MTADEWLAKAMVRMIIADNVLNRLEWKTLKSSIQCLGMELNTDEIFEQLNRKDGFTPEEFRLEPFTSIPLEMKIKMLVSLVKVAAIDRDVVNQEEAFFRKATSLLGLSDRVADELLDWANALADLNRKEEELYDFAKRYQPKIKKRR